MVELNGLPMPALGGFLDDIGVGAKHAAKVFRALHGDAVDRRPLAEVRNLGARHAGTIAAHSRRAGVHVAQVVSAAGGVERLVFALDDGKRVEGVLLPSPTHPGRATLCLSSQVGCAMACRFCATGSLGLTRNLTAAEIVGQVHAARAHLTDERRLTHLVFMGQGEPLHNYSALRDALSILFDTHGTPMARDHVTVSTVGLTDRIERLGRDFGGKVTLAISLHAGTETTRKAIVPTARPGSMAELRRAALAYQALGGGPTMVEYVVLPGVNDTEAELAALAEWMHGTHGMVDLIPFNAWPQGPYTSPTAEQTLRAQARLTELGVLAKVRWPRGREASGACGQLMLAEVGARACGPR